MNRVYTLRTSMLCVLLAAIAVSNPQLSIYAQGSLTPPGAPSATMKSLDQIEPRSPISSLPFTITNSGSYYLTGNLTVTGATAGIIIQSGLSDVTVNLNGFAMTGNSNSFDGFTSIAAQVTNIVVMNGTLRNWSTAVALGSAQRSRVEHLLIVDNRTGAIGLGSDGGIRDCTVINSGGISTSTRGFVADCLVSGNTNGIGINTGGNSIVTRCRVESGTGVGIQVGGDSEVSHCRLVANSLDGIRVDNRCIISENYVKGPGTALGTNACIHAMQDSNRIEQNHVIFHQIGIKVDLGSSFIARNTAYSNGTNYILNANNQFGPTNSIPGVVTNHPWANFAL